MKLSPLIQAIRTWCPYFEQSVGGAAEYGAALEGGKLPLPAAYVIPGEDTTGEQRSQTDYWQSLTDRFSVVVLFPNVDERGQQASCDQLDTVRQELWRALLGWAPDPAYGLIKYAGSAFVDINRAELIWQFHFEVNTDINAEDTRHERDLRPLPDLRGVDVGMTDPSPPFQHPIPMTLNEEKHVHQA